MASLRLFFILAANAILPVHAQTSPENHFISPPIPEDAGLYQNNPVYTEGDHITLSWVTNYAKVFCVWWQNHNDSYQYVDVLRNTTAASPFDWGLSLTGHFDLAAGNVFYVQIHDANSPDVWFGSHYFNITARKTPTASYSSSSTQGPSSSTSSETPSSISATGISIPPAGTSVVTTSATALPSNTGGGLSQGAKIGLGVGIGVGAVAFVAIGITLGFLIRRHRENRKRVRDPPTTSQLKQSISQPPRPQQEYHNFHPDSHASQAPACAHHDSRIPPSALNNANSTHSPPQPVEVPANILRSELDAAAQPPGKL